MIVLDKSGSMIYEGPVYGGSYLLDIAKEAAITVIDALTPKDRVCTLTSFYHDCV